MTAAAFSRLMFRSQAFSAAVYQWGPMWPRKRRPEASHALTSGVWRSREQPPGAASRLPSAGGQLLPRTHHLAVAERAKPLGLGAAPSAIAAAHQRCRLPPDHHRCRRYLWLHQGRLLSAWCVLRRGRRPILLGSGAPDHAATKWGVSAASRRMPLRPAAAWSRMLMLLCLRTSDLCVSGV